MKAIEDLEKRLRGEMASRIDDRDILEVLQGASKEIEHLKQVNTKLILSTCPICDEQ